MSEGYFSRSFRALRSTPHWLGKILILALLCLVPVFGIIAVAGYASGWARDAAWGLDNPMPDHVLGNDDHHQYSRGFFALVISIAFACIPMILIFVSGFFFGATSSLPFALHDSYVLEPLMIMTSVISSAAYDTFSTVLSCAVSVFALIGIVRMSIYAKCGAGFQFRHIFVMAKQDPRGLLKIFGIYFCGSIVIGIVISLFVGVATLFFLPACMGLVYGLVTESVIAIGAIVALVILALFLTVTVVVVSLMAVTFLKLIIYRSMGYWVAQFNVPMWRGQHDPLPFEVNNGYQG